MAKCNRDITYEPLIGQLDGHTQMGAANWRDFRVLLNTQMVEARRLSRRGGWQRAMKDLGKDIDPDPAIHYGNRDLHDQLLGGTGYFEHTFLTADSGIAPASSGPIFIDAVLQVQETGMFHVGEMVKLEGFDELEVMAITSNTVTVRNHSTMGGNVFSGDALIGSTFIPNETDVREPITLLYQVINDCTERVLIAGTRSRLYAFTSLGSNWRILADGLGGTTPKPEDIYSPPRFMAANLGNYVIFTNGMDPVLAWRIGDEPTGWQAWSAHPVVDLAGLGIRSAGVVAQWQGCIFLADIDTETIRECQRIIWSDFNDPLSFAPLENSIAGFVDLPLGERVLRMESLGGFMRVYTTKAIYNVLQVGGEEVFRFLEIYRGPDVLAYKYGLANTGVSHIYLTPAGIVEAQINLNTPQRLEWIHKAGGLIERGLNGELLDGYPGLFTGFAPIHVDKCDQVVAGYDEVRREVWFSWPTMGTPATGDLPDQENTRRMSMVLSRIYESANLVDHGFSAFCNLSPDITLSLSDWMVCIGACHASELEQFRIPKSGLDFNIPTFKSCLVPAVPGEPVPDPDSIINNLPPTEVYPGANDENPDLPPTANSLCNLLGGKGIGDFCSQCDTKMLFLAASLADFTIKEMTPNEYVREFYDYNNDNPKPPFPFVSPGKWNDMGYEMIIQSEVTRYGNNDDKTVKCLTSDFDAEPQFPPLNLIAQVGTSGNPRCVEWDFSESNILSCRTAPDIDPETKDTAPATFPFYTTGRFVAWRLYVSAGANGSVTYSPVGGGVAFDNVILTLEARKQCEI